MDTEIAIDIAVSDPDRLDPPAARPQPSARVPDHDRWSLSVRDGGDALDVPLEPHRYDVDAVALLSGGLDSLIGAIDLTASGLRLLATSHVVRGDAEKQERFARELESIVCRLTTMPALNDQLRKRLSARDH